MNNQLYLPILAEINQTDTALQSLEKTAIKTSYAMDFLKSAAGSVKGMLVDFAIQSAIDGFIWLCTSQERAVQTSKSLTAEYDSLNGSVTALQKQLSATSSSIDQLSTKSPLTFDQQGELKKQKALEESLKNQILLQEELAYAKGAEAEKAALDLMDNTTHTSRYEKSGIISNLGMEAPVRITDIQYAKEMLQRYSELALAMDVLKTAKKEQTISDEAYVNQESDLNAEMASVHQIVTQTTAAINENAKGLTGATKVGEEQLRNVDQLNKAYGEHVRVIRKGKDSQDESVSSADALSASLSNLEAIEHKVASGAALSKEEKVQLQAIYPQLEHAIYKTAEGWVVEAGSINAVTKASKQSRMEMISNEIAKTKAAIENAKNRLAIYGVEARSLNANAPGPLRVNSTNVKEKAQGLKSPVSPAMKIVNNLMAASAQQALDENVARQAALQAELLAIESTLPSSGGSGGSIGKGQTAPRPENTNQNKFEKEYAYITHLKKMHQLSDQQYFDQLNALNQQYFAGRAEYLAQDRKNQEELFDLQRALDQDTITDMEHSIFLLSKQEGTREAQISMEKEKQKKIHEMAQAARVMGLEDNSEYIQELQRQWWGCEENIKSLQETITSSFEKAYTDSLKKEKDALKTILDLTIAMVKKEKEDQIALLDDQVSKYSDVIKAKKESLSFTEKELSYQESLTGQVKDIAKLQSQADLLALDDSKEAKAKRADLLDQIAQKQQDLNRFQHEEAVSMQQNALDEELESFKEEKNKQIQEIKSYLSQSGALTKEAMARMDQDSRLLYGQLVSYNELYGDGITTTVTAAWETAKVALEEYGTALQAITGIDQALGAEESKNQDKDNAYKEYTSAELKTIAQLAKNAAAWKNTTDTALQNKLAEESLALGSKHGFYRENGVWYDAKGKKIDFHFFHTGLEKGFVGNDSTFAQDEFLSLLKSGELLISKEQQLHFMNRMQSPALNATISDAANGGRSSFTIENLDASVVIEGNADQSVVDQIKNHSKEISNLLFGKLNQGTNGMNMAPNGLKISI